MSQYNRPWRDEEEDWSETDDDEDDDFDADAVSCPDCGADVYDDPGQCPGCGYWLTDTDRRRHETGPFRDRNLKIVALVALLAFLLALFGSAFMF